MIVALVVVGTLCATFMFGCMPSDPGPGPEPTGKYSAILENVLKDEYYNGLIDAAKQD